MESKFSPPPGRLVEKLIAGGVAAIVTASRRYRRSGVTGPVAERQADNQEKSVVAWGTASKQNKKQSETKSKPCRGRGEQEIR